MCVNSIFVFDILSKSPAWGTLAVAVVAWLICTAVALFGTRGLLGSVSRVQACVVLAVAGAIAGAMYWFDVEQLRRARLRTEAEGITVTGVVEEFRPEPFAGHAPDEQFRVKSYLFHYSYYDETPFFNTTAAHGGPLRDGLSVRITAVGHQIARLELCGQPSSIPVTRLPGASH